LTNGELAPQVIAMRGFRKHRRAITWVALVAIMGNVLFAFAPAKAAQNSDAVLGPLLMCTADGLHRPVDDGQTPEPGRPNGPHCPNCTLVKSFVFVLGVLAEEFPLPPQGALHLKCYGAQSAAAHPLSLGGVGSRAPPALA
jgi:hypothetical protein